MLVYGVNPVVEALTARPEAVERVLVAEGSKVHDLDRIHDLARRAGVRVERVPRDRIAKLAPGAVHQGVAAELAELASVGLDELLGKARASGEPPLLLALDQVQDPIHLGTAIRCAHAFAAHGVIVPQDRAAKLTPTAIKASAGAASHLRVAQVVNLSRTLEELKQQGIWAVGADMDGEPCDRVDLTGPICLVIGSEGKGLRPLVKRTCDRVVAIPMGRAAVGSLSASAAAGILLYEIDRQRRGGLRS